MKGKAVPDEHHVSRYCSPSRLRESDDRPAPPAFQLRDGEEYLSVDWLEFLHPSDRGIQLATVQDLFEKQRGFELKPAGRFAILNVGTARATVQEQTPDNRVLAVTHLPDPNVAGDSHSGIFNVNHNPASGLLIATLLSETVQEVRIPQA